MKRKLNNGKVYYLKVMGLQHPCRTFVRKYALVAFKKKRKVPVEIFVLFFISTTVDEKF